MTSPTIPFAGSDPQSFSSLQPQEAVVPAEQADAMSTTVLAADTNRVLPELLRDRGTHNSLHDIIRAADLLDILYEDKATLIAQFSAALKKLDEAKAALRPFAKLADMVGEAWVDETVAMTGTGVSITIGQLRRARAAS